MITCETVKLLRERLSHSGAISSLDFDLSNIIKCELHPPFFFLFCRDSFGGCPGSLPAAETQQQTNKPSFSRPVHTSTSNYIVFLRSGS